MAKIQVVKIARATTTQLPHQVAALASEFYGFMRSKDGDDPYVISFSADTKAKAFELAASGFAPRATSRS